MPPLRVLIYEPYTFGKMYGNLRYLILLFKYVDRSRFELIFVAPFQNFFVDRVRAMGVQCIVLRPPNCLRSYGGRILEGKFWRKILVAISILKYTINLSRLIIRENVDIIQCNSVRALLTTGLAAKLTKRPCVWYIKGELQNKLLDRLGFFLADRILFLSVVTKNLKYRGLINRYNDKIDILKIGIDLDEIRQVNENDKQTLKKELCLNEESVNIAYLGVVAPYKGLEYLIEAFAGVKKKAPNVKLYIVGDHCIGENLNFRDKLEYKIGENSLDDNVVFTGWRADALEILSLMDIYVLPSLSEGVPRSIVEAMMLGKPVVATRVGGIPEIVKNGETGLIIDPEDKEGLANAILELAKNKGLREKFGEKAEIVAVGEFSIKDNVAGLEEVYSELSGRLRKS